MNNVEYYERLRDILEPIYDYLGLGNIPAMLRLRGGYMRSDVALNADQMVLHTVHKYGGGEKACERIVANLASVQAIANRIVSLEETLEESGYELEAEPLPREALPDAARRLAESWGLIARPTSHPQSGPVVSHKHYPRRPHSVQGRIMECDECSRQCLDILYVVGRKELCNRCYTAKTAKAFESHDKRRVYTLSHARRVY